MCIDEILDLIEDVFDEILDLIVVENVYKWMSGDILSVVSVLLYCVIRECVCQLGSVYLILTGLCFHLS